MKTQMIFSGAAAMLCAGAFAFAQVAPQGGTQQRPPQPTTQQPTTQQPRASATPARGVTTLTGCLYREQEIPGAAPNVAERAGVGEDYILADATRSNQQRSGTGSPIAGAGDRPGAGATAGLATGRMYKIKKLEEDRLRALVGKRVEVTGTVTDADSASRSDRDTASSDRSRTLDNVPDIEATSVREVAGANCPTSPAGSSPSARPGATTPGSTSPGTGRPGEKPETNNPPTPNRE